LILDAAAIDDLPARCPALHGFAKVSAWRLIFSMKTGDSGGWSKRGVEGRPRPIRRMPCACVQRLQKEDRWGGAPGWTPSAARRRLLNSKYLLIAGSAAATCNFFASPN